MFVPLRVSPLVSALFTSNSEYETITSDDCTVLVHLCIFVLVYIHVFVSVHQYTQPGVLILTIYLCIPHVKCTVLRVIE